MIRNNETMMWSRSSVMCYERGMVCKGCEYEGLCQRYQDYHCSPKPPMKIAVLKLVQMYGAPNREEDEPVITSRVCSKCKRELPISEFAAHGYCKECQREYFKEWRQQKKSKH